MDGFLVDNNTKQCVSVTAHPDIIVLILGPVFGVLALVLIITTMTVIAVMVVRRKVK